VELVCLILTIALAAGVLGLILELTLPASSRLIDAAAALCAFANWIVPLLMAARSACRPPRTSLGSVGITISIFAMAACFSVAGVSFALMTLSFGGGGDRAWLALLAIAAFWLSCVVLIAVASRKAVGRAKLVPAKAGDEASPPVIARARRSAPLPALRSVTTWHQADNYTDG
jgi:hypothetical protein